MRDLSWREGGLTDNSSHQNIYVSVILVFSLSSSIELDQNVGILDAVDVVDVVSCTPGPPPKLLLIDGDEEGLQTRNSSTRFEIQ